MTSPPRALLIIEDDLDVAETLREAVSVFGWTPAIALDGPEGVEKALDGSFVALVVDRFLPSGFGEDAVAELRSRGVRTPVLLVSAGGPPDTMPEGTRFIHKPLSIEQLHRALEEIVAPGGV